MNIEKKTLEKVDVLYDDKKWGKRIDPDEWNANFKTLENAHNQLVDSLTEQVNIVDEAFTNATNEGGDNIHVDYSGGDFTLQQALDHIVFDINDRYTKLQTKTILVENIKPLIRDISYNSQTGTFTITKKDDSVITIDTVIEKVPASMALKEETDGSVWLVVTNQDGSQTKTNVTSLIEDTVINSSDTINVSSSTDSANKVTTYILNIKPNSIGLSHIDSALTTKFEETQNAKTLAVQAKDLAIQAKDAAVTAKNSAVEAKNTSENAAHYTGLCLQGAETASTSAQTAQAAAESARDEAVSAKESASSARLLVAQIANYAKDYKKESEAWATGTVEGTAVDETSDQYQNNSKYYAEKSAESAEAASLSETAAGNAATAASGSASSAAGSATAAAASEQKAIGSATTAASKAAEAANSASEAKAAQAAAEAAKEMAEEIAGGDYATKTQLNNHIEDTTVHVTAEEKAAWNGKSNFSGSYTDITNKPTIPTKTSQLTNDSGYLTSAPVTSVNGKTGAVTLSASDVGALPSSTQIPSISGLATETYVNNKVAGIVNSAPEALDTLNELATALGNDPKFATTVATQIGNKVDKIEGKGLSTNDYTTAEKNKLAGIAEGANNYTHPYSHPATMITEDSTHRFVTDAEKAAWNESNMFIAQHNTTTNAEIEAAYQAGKTILLDTSGGSNSAFAFFVARNAEGTLHRFCSVTGNGIYIFKFENDIFGTDIIIPTLPNVSSTDSGKILMVNSSGVPAWTTITNAEGVSY